MPRFDNYYSDRRVQGGQRRWWSVIDQRKMVATVNLEVPDPEQDGSTVDAEVDVPIKFEVCPTCNGKGTHVNPSIDCDGLTGEDFAEDPDLAEEYMRGSYDVACYECHGERVVPVVDEERSGPDVLKAFNDKQQSDSEFRQMQAAERRFGA